MPVEFKDYYEVLGVPRTATDAEIDGFSSLTEFARDLRWSWNHCADEVWAALRFGEVAFESTGRQHVFDVQVHIDHLPDPGSVRVELYADEATGDGPVRQEMTRVRPLVGAAHGYLYRAPVPALRPAADYTPPVIPRCPGAAVPLEAAHILWRG
jgi:starch phosphorylase